MKKIEYSLLSLCKLKIDYKDSYGNFYTPIIEPYGIKIADNHYLIAKENEKLKTFKISRIQNIEVLEDDYFEKDEDFDINEYCSQSFGIFQGEIYDVILQFSKDAAEDVLNYNFHPTQTMEQQNDGTVIVKFRASGSYEIITELLKWRNCVQIISPKRLKDEYFKTVKEMYKNLKNFTYFL